MNELAITLRFRHFAYQIKL